MQSNILGARFRSEFHSASQSRPWRSEGRAASHANLMFPPRFLPADAILHEPVQFGLRFSTNAISPSRPSGVLKMLHSVSI